MAAPGVSTDEQLLADIIRGSHPAFAQLVERHAARFYRLAWRYVQDSGTAEDIVQDAFLSLWETPGRWNAGKGAAFTTWFHRIVVNRCLDWKKKHMPVPIEDAERIEDERSGQEAVLIGDRLHRRLYDEISALPERQQTAVTLCFLEGLSNREAAEVMEIPLKALQSLLMRGKTALRDRMREWQ